MTQSNNRQSYLPAILAIFITIYYILPRSIAWGIEFILLIWVLWSNGLPKNSHRLPIIWYSTFFVTFLLLELSYPHELSSYVKTCVNCLIFIWITISIVQTQRDTEIFIKSFALSGIIFCVTLLPILHELNHTGVGRLDNFITEEGGGLMSSSIGIAYVLSLLSICQIWVALYSSPNIVKKLVNSIIAICYIIITLMTGTRKAVFAIVLFIILYTIIKNGNKIGKLVFTCMILWLFCIFLLHVITTNEFLYNIIGHRLEGFFNLLAGNHQIDDSSLERAWLLNTSLDIAIKNPILGIGVHNTQYILRMSHPHNNMLTLLNFGGAVLVCLYYWIHITCIRKYVRIIKNDDPISIMLYCTLFAIILTDLTATTYNILYFPIFLTLIINYIHINKRGI